MIDDPFLAAGMPRGLDGLRATDPVSGGRAGMKQAVEGFESMLLQKLVSAMRETIPESGLLEAGPGSQMYDHLIEQALADHLAGSGGLGLERLFAGLEATDTARPSARMGTTPRASDAKPGILSVDRTAEEPLAESLPPQEDTWLHSPEAELKLRELLRGSPDEKSAE